MLPGFQKIMKLVTGLWRISLKINHKKEVLGDIGPMFWQKLTVGVCALSLLAGTFAPVAKAQSSLGSGIVAQQDNTKTDNQNLPGVDLPRTRTGVDPNKVMNLSLRDAVAMALEHNLDIQFERDNIKIAEFNLLAAQGVYDPLLSGTFGYRRSAFPSGSALNRGGSSLALESDSVNGTFRYNQQLTSGGALEAEFTSARTSTNNTFSLLNPQVNSTATIRFNQPLLRNYKIDNNRRNIKSLSKQLDLSDLQFRQRLIDLIARVQGSYYDLVFALENAKIQRESVELAAIQLRNNRIQVNAGTAAPIDIVSAEAALEARKDAAIASLLTITQAENALKALMLDDPASDYWNYALVPTDQLEFSPETLTLQSALDIAMGQRPEIKQLELRGELNKIDLEFFKNQEKPQVDLNASFGGQSLAGQVNQSALPAPVPGQPPIMINDTFVGGFGKTIGNIFDFRTYQVGVTISLPLRNRTAKANISRALVAEKQRETQIKQMMQTITLEVRNAVQAVDAARERVEAANAAVRSAEAQYKGEEQKFSAGLSTNFLVLTRQNELSAARGNLLRAKTEYNKARAELQRVMANNIP